MWRLFRDRLFLIAPAFAASRGLCFVIVGFSGYRHLYLCAKVVNQLQKTLDFNRFSFAIVFTVLKDHSFSNQFISTTAGVIVICQP